MPTKILAIDDSKTMRLAIKITFSAEDAEVVAVSKGSEAVARAKQIEANIVLVDAVLAEGEPSGYDVCRALKADPETSKIPVIMMVSNQVGIDEAAVRECGATGAITKPFDTADLIAKVSAALSAPAVKAPTAAQPSVKPTPVPVAAKPAQPAVKPTPVPVPVAAKPAPAPAKPAPAPAAAKPAPVTPAPVTPAAAKPAPARVTPAAMPAVKPAAAAPTTQIKTPQGFIDMAKIPVVAPIPFTPAHSPSAGLLKRLQEAGAIEGVDPKAVNALVSISREVIEQVVWEVVPDLAEQILGQRAH